LVKLEIALNLLLKRFKEVVWVWGNHEYYGGWYEGIDIHLIENLSQGLVQECDAGRLTIANQQVMVKDHGSVVLIATTLWTDYKKGMPTAEVTAQWSMQDYKFIRQQQGGGKKVVPVTFKMEHQRSLGYVEAHLRWAKEESKRAVVVTHHLPTLQAVNKVFRREGDADLLNYAYASDLDHILESEYAPTHWFCGHTHTPFNQKVGNTQVVINPAGYPGEKHYDDREAQYDPLLTLEI
jgi:hypothetical protein